MRGFLDTENTTPGQIKQWFASCGIKVTVDRKINKKSEYTKENFFRKLIGLKRKCFTIPLGAYVIIKGRDIQIKSTG